MAKKQQQRTTFAEVVAALGDPPHRGVSGPAVLAPVAAGGFTDGEGHEWRLVRGPLDPRRAKRLAVTADLMSAGEMSYDEDRDTWLPRFVPEADRPATWLAARSRFGAHDLPFHEAFEFHGEDGRTLLYIEVYC